ncbi:MAG TPA: preprotein translocase subunit SecE [Zoogloea sp.]|nr:preprotein translocase subunit SecE [Rhodocyclaceae bacterium]HNI49763.1 preprotein translocase subunit SecE [Zoogloea sp.]HMW53738.1 preprotein translocase subunit SecE [Rhodocyclaceae bacterium]HMZ77839.1 preprotein translocase subunit SecE [Rhodocyclaceae bacterium]HNA69125.1 preprotein translocase subunit SecE [Rhodocyclaceae bacterium]
MADKIKFALALVLLVAGVVGFYLLAEQPMVLRVLSVLVGVGACAAVAWKTEPGQRFAVFAGETVAEAKKVAWPSRKETFQMTGIVFAFVIIMAVFLWVTDKTLEWALYDLILGWKKS